MILVRLSRVRIFFPQIVGLKSVRVGRVACAVVPALVERQKPGGFALEMGAHAHFVVIHGKVHHAAPEFEQLFARIAVALVLLHGIGHGLFGEAVLEFKGDDRQAVDEQAQVQCQLGFIAAVAQLAGDRKAVRA